MRIRFRIQARKLKGVRISYSVLCASSQYDGIIYMQGPSARRAYHGLEGFAPDVFPQMHPVLRILEVALFVYPYHLVYTIGIVGFKDGFPHPIAYQRAAIRCIFRSAFVAAQAIAPQDIVANIIHPHNGQMLLATFIARQLGYQLAPLLVLAQCIAYTPLLAAPTKV